MTQRSLNYQLVSPDLRGERIKVRDVPVAAIWIDGDDQEPLDAIALRCVETAVRFVEAVLDAGLVSRSEIRRGHVLVSVDRTDTPAYRGDVSVETHTDLYTFTPDDRSLAAGPQFVRVEGLEFLEDLETASTRQIRQVRDLIFPGDAPLRESKPYRGH
ncbi:hypothetical protein [Burkholderia cepacia]|uniref:hypothetical protein n=1 Tax=Burkholderia cepacia TaxID=292 RepID=UPI001CF553D6|nr:hypothetical protein [Burkholderia cepacia]MCA8355570.1 hypothetical protein [Burkholderia cepacia]